MFNEDFYMLVDSALYNNVISKQLWDFVRTPFPKIATFYGLLKIHKNSVDPPGRPIVSGNGAITENFSKVVDEHLRPFVSSLPSYVRVTIHLLQLIDGIQVSTDSTLDYKPKLIQPKIHNVA